MQQILYNVIDATEWNSLVRTTYNVDYYDIFDEAYAAMIDFHAVGIQPFVYVMYIKQLPYFELWKAKPLIAPPDAWWILLDLITQEILPEGNYLIKP